MRLPATRCTTLDLALQRAPLEIRDFMSLYEFGCHRVRLVEQLTFNQ
jgi:hypothetical protein